MSATNMIVLWTIPHAKEENFLVANRKTTQEEAETNNGATTRPPAGKSADGQHTGAVPDHQSHGMALQ